MKILKEEQINKEELPITFITSFVSRGWEEVGMLKEQIKALKAEFKNIDKIEEILQGLIDAYLINIGQLELFLHENDYVEVPAVEAAEDAAEIKDEKEDAIEIEENEAEDEIEDEPQTEINTAPKEFEAFEYFVDFDDPVGEAFTDEDLYK